MLSKPEVCNNLLYIFVDFYIPHKPSLRGNLFGLKYKGFSTFIKGGKIQTYFFIFFILKHFFNQNRIIRWYYWGPDSSLDTKLSEFELSHNFLSYASYDIKWHKMSYGAYDRKIWQNSISSNILSKEPFGPQ